jgi:2-polyprenyl-3-methyl-5-hydroxy-6-metoxy-1,4-benzoquinol methylase/uncharacterized protein YbaR (Trm112 family)
MRYRLLDVLECPECRSPFRVLPFEIVFLPSNLAIKDGHPVCDQGCPWGQVEPEFKYQCRQCFCRDVYLGIIQCGQNHFFPVVNGIPRLLPNAIAEAVPLLQQHLTNLPSDVRDVLLSQTKMEDKNFEKYFRHTLDSFSSEWGAIRESERAWGRDVPTRRKAFLDCVGIGIEDLPGKKILDAGCGHGEVEQALVKTGAEVFAMDISFSVDGVRSCLEKSESAYASLVHIIQGNIHRLPFRQEVFDIVHCAGVLHHTPDPFRGFEILSLSLKNGGIGYIEVCTGERRNPIEYVVSSVLRVVTTRLPHPILHLFCFAGAPILWLYTHSYNALTGKKLYAKRTIREMELSLFDNFSPRYAYDHSIEQAMSWFNCLGYSNVSKTWESKNANGVVGTKRAGSKGGRPQDSQ